MQYSPYSEKYYQFQFADIARELQGSIKYVFFHMLILLERFQESGKIANTQYLTSSRQFSLTRPGQLIEILSVLR